VTGIFSTAETTEWLLCRFATRACGSPSFILQSKLVVCPYLSTSGGANSVSLGPCGYPTAVTVPNPDGASRSQVLSLCWWCAPNACHLEHMPYRFASVSRRMCMRVTLRKTEERRSFHVLLHSSDSNSSTQPDTLAAAAISDVQRRSALSRFACCICFQHCSSQSHSRRKSPWLRSTHRSAARRPLICDLSA